MKVEIEVNNPNASELLKHICSRFDSQSNDIETFIDDSGGFYKIFFKHRFDEKCPFSLWISIGTGDNLFLNIGDIGDGATVFHHIDITESTAVVVDFFEDFISSSILEERLLCKGKLKKIEYEIKGAKPFPRYSYLHESYLLCFAKSIESKIYKRWVG